MLCIVLAEKIIGQMLCRGIKMLPFRIVRFLVCHDGMVHFAGERFIIVENYCAVGLYFWVLVGGKSHFWGVCLKEI